MAQLGDDRIKADLDGYQLLLVEWGAEYETSQLWMTHSRLFYLFSPRRFAAPYHYMDVLTLATRSSLCYARTAWRQLRGDACSEFGYVRAPLASVSVRNLI